MRVVVQRCLESNVKVNNQIVGKCGRGFMILVGFTYGDSVLDIDYIVRKVINLRVFDDENGVMNKSIIDTNGEILCISQFTLYGNTKKGNRPSYIDALNGDEATILYDLFCDKLNNYVKTSRGIFGEDMKVYLINDGPTTIIIDSKDR